MIKNSYLVYIEEEKTYHIKGLIMTDGTIIVFIWILWFGIFAIDTGIRKQDFGNKPSNLFWGTTGLTAISFGTIKLIDYLISLIKIYF